MVVFTGLFNATPNEDSLASVIGHEVGHVVANHGGEKLSKVLWFFWCRKLRMGLLVSLLSPPEIWCCFVLRAIGFKCFS